MPKSADQISFDLKPLKEGEAWYVVATILAESTFLSSAAWRRLHNGWQRTREAPQWPDFEKLPQFEALMRMEREAQLARDFRRRSAAAYLKERLKALKLLESCSRLACHCDALVFLFYGSL